MLVAVLPGLLLILVAENSYNDTLMGIGVLIGGGGYLALVICQLYLLSVQGQTVGKKAMAVQVVMQDDESNPGFVRVVLLRGGVISLIAAIPVIGPFLALADPLFIFAADRRCIHDHIAGTKVIALHGTAALPRQQVQTSHAVREPATVIAGAQELNFDDLTHRLSRLHQLHVRGILDEREYQGKKRQVMSEIVRQSLHAAPEDTLFEVVRLREQGFLNDEDVASLKALVL